MIYTPAEQALRPTVTIARADLEFLLKVVACYAPYPPAEDIREVTVRALAALRESEAVA